jgi:hypothetical protein
MNRYIIKKYVMAKSLAEALKIERDIKPEDAWKDEKQPEAPQADAIGFNLNGSDYYYSPHMNKKKRK